MRKIIIAFLILVTCFQSFSQRRPNVIFIMADDLGYGDLGCYGQKLIETPHIDRLAANGIRFKQFYAGTSVCAPSRAALMTGQHTGHTAVRGNMEIKPEGQFPLKDSNFTIAELFKKSGYSTAAFGKWGLGYPGSSGDPNNQGFDEFFGYNCQRLAHNYFPDHLWANHERVMYANTTRIQQQYAPDIIQQKAIGFLTTHREQPFFMYLAYTLPHAALQLPEGDELFEKYKKKFNEQAQSISNEWDGVGYQPQAYPRAAYAAMVSRLDRYVGEIVEKLKSLELEKNTLIIFTSDNGPHREGGNMPEYFNSNGGLKGIKRDLYEGGIRVPLIAAWPGVIDRGKESNFVAAAWDFMPTFSEILGQPTPAGADGLSILPTLMSKRNQKEHNFLYWEFHENGGRQAVRMGNWKGVRLNIMKDKDAPVELYNLVTDPNEMNDVSKSNQAIVKKIASIMKKEHVENIDFPFARTTK